MLKKKEYIKPNSLVVCFQCMSMLLDGSGGDGNPDIDTDTPTDNEEMVKGFNAWGEVW